MSRTGRVRCQQAGLQKAAAGCRSPKAWHPVPSALAAFVSLPAQGLPVVVRSSGAGAACGRGLCPALSPPRKGLSPRDAGSPLRAVGWTPRAAGSSLREMGAVPIRPTADPAAAGVDPARNGGGVFRGKTAVLAQKAIVEGDFEAGNWKIRVGGASRVDAGHFVTGPRKASVPHPDRLGRGAQLTGPRPMPGGHAWDTARRLSPPG